jgi:hypothetical protein
VPTNGLALSAFRYHVTPPLASVAVPTQPTGVGVMGADGGDRRRVSPKTEDPSSLA